LKHCCNICYNKRKDIGGLAMQRRYEVSDDQWNKIKHMFPKAKTGRPGKDSRRLMLSCGLRAVVRPGETFLNVSVHGKLCIHVFANGVMKELFKRCLNI